MIKKFIDEDENIFVFIETEAHIIMYLNGQCEWTLKSISMPESIQDARKICRLDIWYPMNEI